MKARGNSGWRSSAARLAGAVMAVAVLAALGLGAARIGTGSAAVQQTTTGTTDSTTASTTTSTSSSTTTTTATTTTTSSTTVAQPSSSSPPVISGQAVVGQTLTASTGTWQGSPTFTYQWLRCDPNGGSCAAILGANQPTYTLTSADAGTTIRVQVTGTNAGGSATDTSVPTAIVQAAPTTTTTRTTTTTTTTPTTTTSGNATGLIDLGNGVKSIPVSSVSLPDRLTASRIRWSPSSIVSRETPVTVQVQVVDSNGFVVRNALVYATGVPFHRLSQPPEAVTNTQGWATLTFQILPSFSLRRGNLIVLFVRARKPGESALAGVSTRRLVALRIG